jgi:hypothetical protein
MNRPAMAFTGFLMIPAALAVARHPVSVSAARSMAPNQFVGTWKLVSTEEQLKDGTTRPYKDVGPRGVGYLMYAADGHMCAVMANPDRPKWGNPPSPSASQKLAAIEGLAAYCGRFAVDLESHVIWHYPEFAWDPGFARTKQRRPYRLEGDRLTFSDKQALEEDQTVDRWTIVWEKTR